MVSKVVFTTLAFIPILMAAPLAEMFGEISCIALWGSYCFHNGILVAGGIGMATYRIMFICLPITTHVKIGRFRLMRVIILAEVVLLW